MTTVGPLALAAVALQLVLTVLLQPFQRAAWLRWPDAAGLIPMWHFFAFGEPGAEWHLLVRDGASGVPTGDWRRIALAPPRCLRDTFWAPHKSGTMLAILMMEGLVRRAAREPAVEPASSVSYAGLLELAFAAPRVEDGTTERQLAIGRGRPDRTTETVFTSRFHPLP